MLVPLVVGGWLACYLGPGPYAQIQFALACVGIFGPLATLGLERILVRDLVEQPQAGAALLGSAFLLKLAGGTVAGGLALAAIAVMRPGDAVARSLVVAAAAMGVVQAADLIESWYQSQVRSHIAVTAIVIATLLTAALRVTLILVHAPLLAFAWSYFAETFLAGLALLLLYRADGGQPFRWRWSRTRALAVLLLSLVFTNLGVARSTFLTAMNWNKAYLFTVFLGAVANVVLNLALIPRYGGLGAAIASLVAYWLAAHGSCYLYRPLFRTGN